MVILSFYLCMVTDLLLASNDVNMQSRYWGSGKFVNFERNVLPLRMV